MWAAINAQDATSLRIAVDQGADVNEPNSEGRVPLYRALILQNQLLVDTLLGLGADANAKDHRGDPLLFTAMPTNRLSTRSLAAISPQKRELTLTRSSAGHGDSG